MNKKRWKMDVIYILLLLFLNPVIFLMHKRFEFIFPDAIAYITMGTELLTEWVLYLQQWGHVDNGLILPPLYPFLVGMGSLFLDDGLIVAELVSSVCIILSIIPLFFYISRLANREIALVTILLIQLNYYYLYFGTLALTEATFILTLSVGLWLAQKSFCTLTVEKFTAILLGLVAALIFFSRQIGLIFIIVIIAMWAVRSLTGKIQQRRKSQATTLYIILGFSLLVVPYGIVLYSQTGQSILTQHFRMGGYVVTQSQATQVILQQITTNNPDLFKKLEIDQTTIATLSKQPLSTGKDDYEDIYIQRRSMRELLPDSSEMHGNVIKESQEKYGLAEKLWEKMITQPGIIVTNLIINFRHLEGPLGLMLPYIFLLTVISAISLKVESRNLYARRLLPLFIVIYLIFISLFTGVVERYMHVIFAFILAHVMIEAYLLVDRLLLVNMTRKLRVLGILLLFSTTLLSMPRLFTSAVAKPKVGERANLLGDCSQFVDNAKEPVFSLHPIYAYLVGGRFRTLPNDSLEKVAQYADKTGVRWLITTGSMEQIYYSKANWLKNKNLENQYPELVTLRCQAEDKLVYLYEFKMSKENR